MLAQRRVEDTKTKARKPLGGLENWGLSFLDPPTPY